MNPRRVILAGLMAAVLSAPLLADITITPLQPNADQAAAFSVSRPFFTIIESTVSWSFGDGATASGSHLASHAYSAPGTYSITCQYYAAGLGGSAGPLPYAETASLTVIEMRRITYTPAAPLVGQPVAFTALNFLSMSVLWDFGDGTPASLGGTTVSHAYALPGPFTVKAKDLGGASATTLTASLNVGLDATRRQISYAPLVAFQGRPITFSAHAFYTTDILWDFGDGSSPVAGGTTAVHAFAGAGTFQVRAWDWGGRAGAATAVPITVREETGPRAPFRIFVLQMRFADGLAYKIVSQGAAGLTAFADIKYEGSGMFEAQWTIDGMPFRPVTRVLPFALSTTIDTGRVPALPTTEPGLHEVGLRISQPGIDFTVPAIRYYVVAGGIAPSLRPVRIEVKAAEGLKGVSCSLVLDTLKVRTGSYFILNGTVRHDLDSTVRFGLLRIHLDEVLVDQQILRDLEPGHDRPFATSIQIPPAGAKTIYVSLYDIADSQAPRLLYIKKIAVLPEKE